MTENEGYRRGMSGDAETEDAEAGTNKRTSVADVQISQTQHQSLLMTTRIRQQFIASSTARLAVVSSHASDVTRPTIVRSATEQHPDEGDRHGAHKKPQMTTKCHLVPIVNHHDDEQPGVRLARLCFNAPSFSSTTTPQQTVETNAE